MYYYAVIELETGICYDVIETDYQITDDPSCIEIGSNDKSYLFRKKYVDDVWVDTTPAEAQQFEGAHIGIHGEWLDIVIDGKADIDHVHDGYATTDHSHTEYASSDDLQVLADVVDTKADTSHAHTEYSSASHIHNDYAAQVDLDILAEEVSNKASSTHNHNSTYATLEHNHDDYSPLVHSHTPSEIGAAISGHNHDSDYASISALDELSMAVSGKANTSHSHDDRYYTETEIDSKLVGKSDTTHTHTGVYDASGSAASALTSANAYTDSKIDALVGDGASTTLDTIGEISAAIEDNQEAIDLLNSAIANKANVIDLNAHANDNEIHITETERNHWNAKSNFSGNYNDLTNKPAIPSINGLASETYVDTQIDAIDIPNALSDLTTDSTHRLVTDAEKAAWNAKSNFSGNYNDLTNKPTIPSISGLATETYVDEAVSAKADSTHTHDNRYYTETEVDTLLSAKANSNHNHNASYDALGTAETKASAVQSNLDAVNEELTEHIDNDAIHFTAAERTKLSNIAANANNYTHPNSGVTAGTYKSVTVNAQGHITSGSNPTTLAGYGITDAESKGAANSALVSAKEYADELIADEVANRDSAIAAAKSSALSAAASDATTKADNALASAKTYVDESIDVLSETVSAKANTSSLTSHTGNTTVHITATERTNWNAAKAHADSAHAPTTNASQTASGLMSKADKIKLDGVAEGANNYTLPSAGSSLGGVKSGGDVTISSGVITVNDDSHNHIISNVDGLQSALDSKAASGHNHDGVYYTETETDTLLEGKANTSHTHNISNITNLQSTLDGKANASHGTHVSYSTTAPVMDGTASVGAASTVARSDHKHPTDTSRAAQSSLDSHTSNKSNPHGVTLAQLGLTATASEINVLDGITATVTELNYVDGVTSNIQTQLNGKAASGHTHNYAGSSSAGGAATSADKLNANAGDSNTPVYFSNGVPVACTSLDLNTTGNAATATNVAWSGVTSKPSYYDAKAIKGITRSGITFTYTCMDGTTGTFTQQDNNTTYSVATTSANGLMSASDKSKLDGMVVATVSEVETYLGI